MRSSWRFALVGIVLSTVACGGPTDREWGTSLGGIAGVAGNVDAVSAGRAGSANGGSEERPQAGSGAESEGGSGEARPTGGRSAEGGASNAGSGPEPSEGGTPGSGTGGESQGQAGVSPGPDGGSAGLASGTGGSSSAQGGSGPAAAGAGTGGNAQVTGGSSSGGGEGGSSAGTGGEPSTGGITSVNQPPVVEGVTLEADYVEVGSSITVTCDAVDPEGGSLEYEWTVEAGDIGTGNPTVFTPDAQTGEVEIQCLVRDSSGHESTGTATVEVLLPSSGLVAHWPFDGDLTDVSGNGHHGSAVGGADQYTTDRFGDDGQALLLNGARYVSVPHASALSLTTFTFTAWVAPATKTGSRRVILSKPSSTGFGNYTWHVMASDHGSFPDRLGYVHDTSGGNWSATCTGADCVLSGDTLTHVAVVVDGGTLTYYVNGEEQNSATPSAAVTNTLPLCIGSRCGSEGFTGTIDDVRIYDRSLSALEIEALAADATDPSVVNQAPEVQSVTPEADTVEVGSSITVTCDAVDPEGDSLEYEWTASAGDIGTGNPAVFTPDAETGNVDIECLARDTSGNESTGTATVEVLLPSSGLVAYWPFDGNLTDVSGNGHNGSAVGGAAQYTTDRFGASNRALLVDGTRYVSVPHASALSLTTFTFTAWVAPATKTGSRRVILSKPSSTGFGNYTWHVMASDHGSFPDRLGYVHDTSGGNWSATCTGPDCVLPSDALTHVAVVISAGTLTYYVNGVQQSTATPSAAVTNTLPLCIGSRCGSEGFTGTIDDVRIYDRGLSALEIEALAADATDPSVVNQAPEVLSVTPEAGSVDVGSSITVTCNAVDPEGDSLEYEWTASAGDIGTGNPAVFTPDAETGSVDIECLARDTSGNESTGTATVEVLLPSSGLVAYWPFDGNLTDASGNGHNGSAVGGTAQYTTDRFGASNRALLVDGTRYVSVPDQSALRLTTFTFAAWLRPGAKNGSGRTIVSKPSATGFGNYTWELTESDHSFYPDRPSYVHDTSGGNWSALCPGTACALAAGVDVHLAVIVNGTTPVQRHYVNGVQQSTATPSAAVTNTLPVCIGSRCGSDGFVGTIDEVRIYGRELTPLELEALAGG